VRSSRTPQSEARLCGSTGCARVDPQRDRRSSRASQHFCYSACVKWRPSIWENYQETSRALVYLTATPLSNVAVSLFLPEKTPLTTVHWRESRPSTSQAVTTAPTGASLLSRSSRSAHHLLNYSRHDPPCVARIYVLRSFKYILFRRSVLPLTSSVCL
jgi:hypothetical protein